MVIGRFKLKFLESESNILDLKPETLAIKKLSGRRCPREGSMCILPVGGIYILMRGPIVRGVFCKMAATMSPITKANLQCDP